jgi:hypothetical protein
MEIEKSTIVEKATHIIMATGLNSLTIHNLATELHVKESQLYNQLTSDDDILLILLYGFETYLNKLVPDFVSYSKPPDAKLELLFKKLHLYFIQNPFYLAIIFDKRIKERDESIKKSFLRIKNIAENCLSSIIDEGKEQNIFKTKVSTSLLAGKILSSFRIFMKDEQLVNEMILELKTLRTLND